MLIALEYKSPTISTIFTAMPYLQFINNKLNKFISWPA